MMMRKFARFFCVPHLSRIAVTGNLYAESTCYGLHVFRMLDPAETLWFATCRGRYAPEVRFIVREPKRPPKPKRTRVR